MLIIRAYVNRRAASARILAAVAAGALIAGCGGGGGSTPPASTPPANASGSAATPGVSNSGVGVQAATGSGGNGATAGSVGSAPTGSFASGGAGQLSRPAQASFSSSRSESISSSRGSQIMSAAQAKRAQQQANHAATTTTPRQTPVTKPPVAGKSTTAHQTAPPVKPKTRVVVINHIKRFTVYRTRTRIRYRTRTRTITRRITRTVTRTVAPKVPAGAYMPSTHPELAQGAFMVTGANIGCKLAGTGVRCGIEHRSWDPPAQPKSCKSTWGNALVLASKGLPKFSCGGSDPIDTAAKVIPSGWDTTLDGYTCQVRSFAVDCFNSKSNSGFTLSRTGYSIY